MALSTRNPVEDFFSPDLAPSFAIRRMRMSDLEQVEAIEAEAFFQPWPRVFFRDCITAAYECWVAERDGRLEAYSVMSTARGVAHLLNICVRAEERHKGLGRRLLAHMIETARCDAHSLVLEVRVSNQPAIKLYRAMGFHELGRRRGYYRSPQGREDACVLALQL